MKSLLRHSLFDILYSIFYHPPWPPEAPCTWGYRAWYRIKKISYSSDRSIGCSSMLPAGGRGSHEKEVFIFLLIRLPQSISISFQGQKESQGVTGRGGLKCVCCFLFKMKNGHVGYPLAWSVWYVELKIILEVLLYVMFWSAVHNKQPGDDRFQAASLITSLINDYRSCPGCLIFLFYTFTRGVSPCNFHQRP